MLALPLACVVTMCVSIHVYKISALDVLVVVAILYSLHAVLYPFTIFFLFCFFLCALCILFCVFSSCLSAFQMSVGLINEIENFLSIYSLLKKSLHRRKKKYRMWSSFKYTNNKIFTYFFYFFTHSITILVYDHKAAKVF